MSLLHGNIHSVYKVKTTVLWSQDGGHGVYRHVRDPLTAHSRSFLNLKGNKAKRTKQTAALIRFFPLRYSLVRDHLTLGGGGRGKRERYLCVRKSGLWVLKKIYT